ncbi:protein adenylyltransferase SelO-like isoform X2 [Maniola hyperantus]|uniref:protein adenylyltransferase SelO-like isoform X2 n=1 Tax=Aphantopus hyperantus TaxID=2795564 RepID=UPI002130083B
MKRAFCVLVPLFQDTKFTVSTMAKLTDFKEWKFRSSPSYAELPIDENPQYNEPVAVKNAVFSKVPTEPLTGKLHLVCVSEEALSDILDLDPKVAETEEFVNFLAGKYLPEGGLTVSHRYGGYQFGFWADQLGDGRAHILGEYVNSKGECWQPQLKGSGETPYSRFGDGRAVLRSSVREMVASEACHHLGVPTTRAAGLVVSDDHKVWRDKTYSGMARQERAAIVMRVARAWYRLGSFEILLKRKEPQLAQTLADFIIKHHFPHIDMNDADKYVKWFSEVAHTNLDMVATWQGVGFTHGVLNTDNISVLGDTIDYGPYGFMDHYYEHYVPNSSDDMGRYAFNKQPEKNISCKTRSQRNPRWRLVLHKGFARHDAKHFGRLHMYIPTTGRVSEESRRQRMSKVNPLYVPRNWMLQEAIADADNNDFHKVRLLLKIFKEPYSVNKEAEMLGYSSQPPSWSYGLKLSCSS